MTEPQTEILGPDAEGIARAAALLVDGALVAVPTETVYGLGADAGNDRAVAGIFEAKGRPVFNPLIVHVTDLGAAEKMCIFNPQARALAAAFWPGPLTLVLPVRPGAPLSRLVTAGLDTVAVRVPAHPVARAVLAAFAKPVAAPSANLSGKVSPTTAAHVLAGLAGRIAAVVDAGPCDVGVESTIVGFGQGPVLLRAGGVPLEALETCLGVPVAPGPVAEDAAPLAPGMMTSHYAPKGVVRLNAVAPMPGEVFLGFGPGPADMSLSPEGDLTEAAARLFDCLHQLDAIGVDRIAVAPIPEVGLGRAINDRLRRAAAPRTEQGKG